MGQSGDLFEECLRSTPGNRSGPRPITSRPAFSVQVHKHFRKGNIKKEMMNVIAITTLLFIIVAARTNLVVANQGYLNGEENFTDEDGTNDATSLQSSVTNVSNAS